MEVENENYELKTEIALKELFNDSPQHPNQIKFTRKYCDYDSFIESNLKKHPMFDHRVSIFTCDQCSFQVTSLRNLKVHESEYHN